MTQGGSPAKSGKVTVIKPSGETEVMGKSKSYALQVRNRVILETDGGGGWGPSGERAIELIQRDLNRCYISEDGAKKDYGVRVEAGKVSK